MSQLKLFRREEGKTLTFWATEESEKLVFDARLFAEFVKEAGDRNARICFHQSPDASFHEMMVLEKGGHYFPPHRHPLKGEVVHMMYGMVTFATFTPDGEITQVETMNNGLFRAKVNEFHFINVVSPMALYYEVKLGPFLGEADREFAPWAPKVGDHGAIADWMKDLVNRT